MVAGLLVAGGLAGAGVSGGLTLVIGLFATLSINATINAVFTYRFLAACARVIEESSASNAIVLKWFANQILDQLISLAELPKDLVSAGRLMILPVL